MKGKQRFKMAESPNRRGEDSWESFEGFMSKSTMEPVQWKRINKVEQDCDKIVMEMRKLRAEFGEVIQALTEVEKER